MTYLALHVILIEDLEGILVVNKSGKNFSPTSQLRLRAVFQRLLMEGELSAVCNYKLILIC